MSGGAIAGAAVIGAGASIYSSNKASAASSSAANQAALSNNMSTAIAAEDLAFRREQYQQWEDTFGPVSANLSDYYNRLDADNFTSRNLAYLNREYEDSIKNLSANLAQRGLESSGAAAEGLTVLEQGRARDAAEIRSTAPEYVAQQQASFLGMGLGLESSLSSGLASSSANLSNIYSNSANQSMALQSQYANQASQAMTGVGQAVGTGVSSYMMANALQAQNNTAGQTAILNTNASNYWLGKGG